MGNAIQHCESCKTRLMCHTKRRCMAYCHRDGSDLLREQVRLLKDAGWIAHAKEFERAITALRIIHTWATFQGGIALDPKQVETLTRKALKGFFANRQNTEGRAISGAEKDA